MANVKATAELAPIRGQRFQPQTIAQPQDAPNAHSRVCGVAETYLSAARGIPTAKID
jgi:hypothetical protein